MGETRVNLRHLLEDIRDAYPFPAEEAIITELVANSLDSKASRIEFYVEPQSRKLCVIDDGNGMKEKEFEDYHDIATTTKSRGKGIGFAGIGAKLALLYAEEVITETKRGIIQRATKWKLKTDRNATWDYISPPNLVSSDTGTAVLIVFSEAGSPLTNFDFILHTIKKHFSPLLNQKFLDKILGYVYRESVSFFINGQQIQPVGSDTGIKDFWVYLKKKKHPAGYGFIKKSDRDYPEEERGIAISTYGKVIKRGWDWLGILPKNPAQITGIVELPAISEILTTNKADFLRDIRSLKIYYNYRKAVLLSIESILKEIGEISSAREKVEKNFRPLEKEIEKILQNMIDDFPELSPLFERKQKGELLKAIINDPDAPLVGKFAEGTEIMTGTKGNEGEGEGIESGEGALPGKHIEPDIQSQQRGELHQSRRKRPGLMLGFEDNKSRTELGWLSENTLWINKAHPAYRRAVRNDAEEYHVVLSAAWVLSSYLEKENSPQEFINRFLSNWGFKNDG
ncbi:MAG: ATP-binding protein [Candidatus Omnitrophica bacterium]|nr:ATP-binding protein [Candidatus Omnitrophota bacterium]